MANNKKPASVQGTDKPQAQDKPASAKKSGAYSPRLNKLQRGKK